ncbi:MAG TPA: glucosamine-6-phosphate deaminase [Vicinamibacterales bacterium]|nr:glucosamine-6-phosphate deaminase [Vicinamibacterales bacterium]HOG28855.1 glucosamine-6-phosphate deaminase [Vicinamibacterales bacterium]HOQ59930.1 glucosamine-6-phosphate deaminase [Vicinamibacterales bacterium]HPK70497.1 glucosamine-6-phosphate deaminase [Vicinamibacterales bacterium]HPW21359.1 glucosamine-6-phosphate deaminase [Vicinamibacterales bacterium]
MIVKRFDTRPSMARAAAAHAALAIRQAVAARGRARIVVATGASQIEFLQALTADPSVDWARVALFHLDEYVGLPITHPASFRKYILERVIRPVSLSDYLLLDGEGDPAEVCRQAGAAIAASPVDVAFVGIGENGHLAFNDPPADFVTEEPYLVVQLDEACRRQQVGEGWFASVAEVPASAISMSVRQILKAREIICVVPDARKAVPVKAALEGPVTPDVPASALREHANVTVYLDADSAALLEADALARFAPPVA